VESDIRYYRRRACEEMSAATRAVTDEARERRLRLVDLYVRKLEELKVPSPFNSPVTGGAGSTDVTNLVRDRHLHELA